jgi:hypothetical protein
LKSLTAVAGFGEGWDHNPYFVSHDDKVRELRGYQAIPVSTPPVERFIAVSDPTSLVAFVYTFFGNSIWVISSDQGTWEFNVTTRQWHERVDGELARWRAFYSIKSENLWFTGDLTTTNLLFINDEEYPTWQVESADFKGFPSRVAVPGALFNFTEAAINVDIEWSLNSGKTWFGPLTRSLTNAEKWPPRVNRLGLSTQHGIRFRLTVEDAEDVDFSFVGGSVMGPEVRKPKPEEDTG